MANQEQLTLLKQGVTVWNQWREEHRDIQPELCYANLSRANLSHANLISADLSYANLWYANLSEADSQRCQPL